MEDYISAGVLRKKTEEKKEKFIYDVLTLPVSQFKNSNFVIDFETYSKMDSVRKAQKKAIKTIMLGRQSEDVDPSVYLTYDNLIAIMNRGLFEKLEPEIIMTFNDDFFQKIKPTFFSILTTKINEKWSTEKLKKLAMIFRNRLMNEELNSYKTFANYVFTKACFFVSLHEQNARPVSFLVGDEEYLNVNTFLEYIKVKPTHYYKREFLMKKYEYIEIGSSKNVYIKKRDFLSLLEESYFFNGKRKKIKLDDFPKLYTLKELSETFNFGFLSFQTKKQIPCFKLVLNSKVEDENDSTSLLLYRLEDYYSCYMVAPKYNRTEKCLQKFMSNYLDSVTKK